MNSVEKALWFIETRFDGEMSLDDIARASGASRFQLSRAFAVMTGLPVMRYVRARRLSQAAKLLAAGAPDILDVALGAGYGSHEAFTRAFRDQFDATPEQVRERRATDHLAVQEPLRMPTAASTTPLSPKFVDCGPLLIAGINAHYAGGPGAGIPAQWQQFAGYIGHVPGQIDHTTFGVIHNNDDACGYDYLCGVEVSDFAEVPTELTRLRIAAGRYAMFEHTDHVSSIAATIQAIWTSWLPIAEVEALDAPSFERYGPSFDPRNGMGGLEIWIPIVARPTVRP